jgi:hypothetical protein
VIDADRVDRLRASLAGLSEVWSRHGFWVAESAAPGLDEREIRRQLTAYDLDPPAELLTWWGWHNGVLDPEGANQPDLYRSSGIDLWALISLDEAIEIMRAWRVAADRASAGDVALRDDVWPQGWLPILGGGSDSLIMRCDGPLRGSLTIKERDEPANATDVKAASIAELVENAITVIEDGSAPDRFKRVWKMRPPSV